MTATTYPRLDVESPNENRNAGHPPDDGSAQIGIWESMRRHWIVAMLPALLLIPIGVGIGVARSPRYTAESRLIVGRLAIGNPGLSGFVTATQSLASAYSRAVTATGVVEPVARKLGMTTSEVGSRVAGSPIQQSPVLRIIATGTSTAQAIALANTTSTALIAYVSSLNRENPDGSRLLTQYGRASRAFNRADLKLQAAQGTFRRRPNAAHAAALSAATSARAAAQLEMQTAGALYQASEAGQAAASLVGTLNDATSATSDRRSVEELLGIVGALVGLAIGAALATARAKRVTRAASRPTG